MVDVEKIRQFKPILYILKILAWISCIFSVVLVSVIGFIIKSNVQLFLKYKHGARFYKMMDGGDRIWTISDLSKSQIIILIIFDYDLIKNGDILENFKQRTNKEDLIKLCPKAIMKRRFFLGYDYFIKKSNRLNIVGKMKSYKSIKDLQKLVSEYSSEPIGKLNDEMIEIKIGTIPISWTDNGKKQYPMIVKVHHTIGDGISLNNLFTTMYAIDPVTFIKDNYFQATTPNHLRKQPSIISKALDPNMYFNPVYDKNPLSILRGTPISGSKNLVWKKEFTEVYIEMVKNIKKQFKTSFNVIMVTAIAASFNRYFQKVGIIPNFINTGLVVLPNIPKFQEQVTIQDNMITSLNMDNKFLVLLLKLTMHKDESKISMIFRMKDIMNEYKKLLNSLDIYYHNFIVKYIFSLLPSPLVKKICKYFEPTIGLSNLPGWSKFKMFHGGDVQDIFFWVPNFLQNGIGVSIFSYDSRFELGLIADKAIISEVSTAQEILDAVFEYIEILDKESKEIIKV